MARPLIALLILAAYFAVALVARFYWHWRRTGRSGFLGVDLRLGTVAFWSGALVVFAALLAPLGCALDLAGVMSLPAPGWTAPAGVAAAILGTVGTVWAQATMGASWRVGVDASERTALVERGVFGLVRNPIFTFAFLTMAGVAAIAPNVLTLASLLLLVPALEAQVRFVEEPYLLQTHGARYERYRERVGRFLPGTGLARPSTAA